MHHVNGGGWLRDSTSVERAAQRRLCVGLRGAMETCTRTDVHKKRMHEVCFGAHAPLLLRAKKAKTRAASERRFG